MEPAGTTEYPEPRIEQAESPPTVQNVLNPYIVAVAALRDFKLTRAYFDAEPPEAEREIREIVEKEMTVCC